jgi:hypothetical protein
MHFSTRPETPRFPFCLDLMNGCQKLNGAAQTLTPPAAQPAIFSGFGRCDRELQA